MSKTSNLTARQADVLGVVAGSRRPVTARDVGEYHLPIGASSARASLAALERKGLVAPQYTGHSERGRAYVVTAAGEEALAAQEETDSADLTDLFAMRQRRKAGRADENGEG